MRSAHHQECYGHEMRSDFGHKKNKAKPINNMNYGVTVHTDCEKKKKQ